MNDKLHAYIKSHSTPVPKAPAEEWARILTRTQQDRTRRQHRAWLYLTAVTLSAAGLLVVVNLPSTPRADDARLELEEVTYPDDVSDRGAYGDWLWLTDSVDAGDE